MVASNSPSIKNTEKSGTKWDTIRRREHNQFFLGGGGEDLYKGLYKLLVH